jgi:predicted DNA-binding transcriptional regulator AlpA
MIFMTSNDIVRPPRLIFKPEVLDRVGVTYPTIWTWMRDGKFPRSRVVGGKIAWIESEIDDWIGSLPVRRLKGDAERECAARRAAS